MPNEINEATSAAMAKAVPVLSVSTTVRTPPVPTAAGLTPVGAGDLDAMGADPPMGLSPDAPGPGMGGLLPTGKAAVAAEAAGLLAPGPPGLGGREILMVSFRRSEGGLAKPGTAGTEGLAAPGIGGGVATGFGNAGMAGTGGVEEATGFGGGASRMVSFFKVGIAGTAGKEGLGLPGASGFGVPGVGSGDLIVGVATGKGGLRAGAGGGPGGRGGGMGTPSAIWR